MKTKKTLILIILLFVLFIFGCKKPKEEIIPHFVITIDDTVVSDKIELEYGDVSVIKALFYSEEYPLGTNSDIKITKNGSDEILLLKENTLICLGIGESEIIIDREGFDTLKVSVSIKEREKRLERILIKGNNVLGVGESQSLIIDSYGASLDLDEIEFTSSDENIATIESDGYVMGLNSGVCVISAHLKNNPNVSSQMSLTIIDYGEVTESASARFMINEATDYKVLPYGVIFQKITGLTSTPLQGADADGYSGITAPLIPNQYYLQQISLLEVPSVSDVMITSWANWGGHRWTLTTVKGLITNFEKNNPGWKVIAAINGDFFDISANGNLPYQTSSVVVSNGNYYKTTGNGLVGFPNDGSGVVGNKPLIRSKNMHLDVLDNDGNIIKSFEVENLNKEPLDGESSLYFARYNSEKNIESFDLSANGVTYFIRNAELALPNNENDFYGRGTIEILNSEININKGNFAIVSKNSEINSYLKDGMRIRIQYVLEGEYSGIENITGCGGTIMLGGEYNPAGAINDRAPRTVIGKTSDGRIIMMVIDGRQGNKNMYGADARELAAIMKAYGCVEAFNLDGGGSSTMVIRQNGTFVVTNSPSDGHERSDSNCVLVVVRDIDFNVNITEVSKTKATINVDIVNSFGKDIQKLYVKVEGRYYELIDGKVEINNLVHNSTYNYLICYENSKGEMLETLTGGEIKTEKDIYTYLNTFVYEDSEYYIFEVRYLDTDNSSTIGGSKLDITSTKDGETISTTTFLNGQGISKIKKSILGDEIKSIDIAFSYQVDYKNRIGVDWKDIDFTYIIK